MTSNNLSCDPANCRRIFRNKIVKILEYGFAILLGVFGCVYAKPVTDANSVFSYSTPPNIGYLHSFIDPVFGTKITKITGDPGEKQGGVTWGDIARHHYSIDQAWNANQTALMIINYGDKKGRLILDGQTYQLRTYLNFRFDDIRWHPRDPAILIYTRLNKLMRYNISTKKHSLIWEFSEYPEVKNAIRMGPRKGNISTDGKWLALFGQSKNNEEYEVTVFNIEQQKKEAILKLEFGFSGYATMSASGKYVVFCRGDTDSRVYDRNLRFLLKLPENISHYDLAVDTDGEDVAVGVSKPGKYAGKLIKLRLSDGKLTILNHNGYAGHTSARNINRPGWAYVTYENRGPTHPPFFSEILAVKMDGSGAVERLAHTHNLHKSGNFRAESQACPSPDGTKVIFASTWDNPNELPVGCYVIDVNYK